MKLSFVFGLAGALLFLPSFQAKADTVTPFGDTTGTGPWTLTSTASTYSGLTIVPSISFTFSGLSNLSAIFTDIAGGAYGGSPRFSVGLQDGSDVHFIHIAIGTSPNYNDSNPAAFTTAFSGFNVIGNDDTGRYDTSQFAGGSPFTNYTSTLALLGSLTVTELDLVLDGGWGANGNQELIVNQFTATAVAVPVPIVGAGFPGLIFAGGGVLAWWRKRRKAAVSL